MENNTELYNTGKNIQKYSKKLIQCYCTIYSLNDTFFHKIACETNVGLKQSRLGLVKSKGALNLMYVEAMGC